MSHNNQKGFSVMVAMLALLAVIGIGFGAWYVAQKRSETKPVSQSQVEKQASNTKDQNTKEERQSDPSEGGEYLVINEWEVRFTLPEELQGDVKYGVFTFKNGDQAVYFASKKLAANVRLQLNWTHSLFRKGLIC